MRLSIFRAGAIVALGALALAACSSSGTVPSSPTAYNPMALNNPMLPLGKPSKLTKCATTPPQYLWVFEGACAKVDLAPSGASFSLAAYKGITVKGTLGKNNLKLKTPVYIADATGDKNIKTYKGLAFPALDVKGAKVVLYASVTNQGKDVIKPIAVPGKPVFEFVITDDAGVPGTTCHSAGLAKEKKWEVLPNVVTIKGKTITVTQHTVPEGLELAPKTPLYLTLFCT
jgi:hypothetical protein